MVAVALAGLLAMTAVAVYALVQRRDARGAARSARSQELVARSIAALDVDPERSLELAVRAAGLRSTSLAEDALRRALLAARLRRVLSLGGPAVVAGYDADGDGLLATRNGDVDVLRRGSLLRLLHVRAPLTAATFDRSGRRVLVASRNAARLVDARTGASLATLHHRSRITGASFSGDGARILTGSTDRTAVVWRARR